MKKQSVLTIRLDDQGHLVLPDDLLNQYGLLPGSDVQLEQATNGIQISRSSDNLARVYVEPTSACNLDCRTCMRNVWDEPMGQMSEKTYSRILQAIQAIYPLPIVFFGGFGEPLAHPNIVEMVSAAHKAGAEVELITNGTLLDKAMSLALLESGLNRLWVSLDGAKPESYADVRLGASLPQVVDNLARLHRLRLEHPTSHMGLGIAFVAMRRNITDLPELIRLGKRHGADQFSISNVLPHTEELRKEILYQYSLYDTRSVSSPSSPEVDFPRMDISRELLDVIRDSISRSTQLNYRGHSSGPDKPSCPFIEKDSISIRWDGFAAPCLPLLHTHEAYLDDRLRKSFAYSFGNIHSSSLMEIWQSETYKEFRSRLLDFDFSPCTFCNSCEMSASNLEDCFGNVHPTCGGCLWAQGFIRCP